MAGAGYKLFNTGDVLTAAQVNTYLQEQAVMRFANATARTTALSGVLAEGMMSYLDDTNSVEVYNGSAWVSVGSTGDITGVTAGTGISGGGTSGDVTITNSMATTIDAKGDLIVGTGSDTFARLAVGTNDFVLTAASGEATGLKWAAVAGGDWTFGAWTPTYTGLTVGNGTVTARYAQKGKLVVAWWKLLFGSTTSCTGITVSTPVNPYTDYAYSTIVEAQAGNVNYIMSTSALSNKWYLRAIDTSGTYAKIQGMNATTPGTWSSASGDYIALVSVYEAA